MAGINRMWAMRMARSIRQVIHGSQPCRDLAIRAFLDVFMEDNPTFDYKMFRAVANGTVDVDPVTDKHYENWRKRHESKMGHPD